MTVVQSAFATTATYDPATMTTTLLKQMEPSITFMIRDDDSAATSPVSSAATESVDFHGTTITFALNFYDANNPLGDGLPGNGAGQACGKPYSNTRCRVEVEVNYWMRTFNLKDVDLTTCAALWDWTASNKKYQDIAF